MPRDHVQTAAQALHFCGRVTMHFCCYLRKKGKMRERKCSSLAVEYNQLIAQN